MNNNVKSSIKAITEGAVFTAIYGLLAIAARYLFSSADSMLYYFTPLPVAIYVIRQKLPYSIAVTAASIVLSFLFADPTLTLMVIAPNIIIGFILGCFEKHSKIKILNYLVIIISCILSSFLRIEAYELLTGIDYWEDISIMFNNMTELFDIDLSYLIDSLVKIISITVIIVDSIIKTVLLYLIFVLIIKRLKLINEYSLKVKIPLKYNFIISLVYILFVILMVIFLNILVNQRTLLIELLVVLFLSIVLLYSFYLMYQFMIYLRFKFKKLKNSIFVIIIILLILLMPISVLGGLFLNLINYNILLDFVK